MDAADMKRKIVDTLNNRRSLSQSEIDAVWSEVTEFIQSLPKQKRGAFYWNSCAEALFMMTSESLRNGLVNRKN